MLDFATWISFIFRCSIVAQTVKNQPPMQGIWAQLLGWEDALEEEMAAHSSSLARKSPWTEEPGGLQSMKSQSRTWPRDQRLHFFAQFSLIFMVPGFGIKQKNIALHNPKVFLIFSLNSLVFLYLHLKFLEYFSTWCQV